jgi:hypothetical protein
MTIERGIRLDGGLAFAHDVFEARLIFRAPKLRICP